MAQCQHSAQQLSNSKVASQPEVALSRCETWPGGGHCGRAYEPHLQVASRRKAASHSPELFSRPAGRPGSQPGSKPASFLALALQAPLAALHLDAAAAAACLRAGFREMIARCGLKHAEAVASRAEPKRTEPNRAEPNGLIDLAANSWLAGWPGLAEPRGRASPLGRIIGAPAALCRRQQLTAAAAAASAAALVLCSAASSAPSWRLLAQQLASR